MRFFNKEPVVTNENKTIVLVQPNIKQKDKWNIKRRKDHIQKLIKLSFEKEHNFENKYKIIIWPETSFEGFIPNELNLLSSILALVYSVTFNVIPMTITNISSALFSLVLYNYKFTNERNIETSV